MSEFTRTSINEIRAALQEEAGKIHNESNAHVAALQILFNKHEQTFSDALAAIDGMADANRQISSLNDQVSVLTVSLGTAVSDLTQAKGETANVQTLLDKANSDLSIANAALTATATELDTANAKLAVLTTDVVPPAQPEAPEEAGQPIPSIAGDVQA